MSHFLGAGRRVGDRHSHKVHAKHTKTFTVVERTGNYACLMQPGLDTGAVFQKIQDGTVERVVARCFAFEPDKHGVWDENGMQTVSGNERNMLARIDTEIARWRIVGRSYRIHITNHDALTTSNNEIRGHYTARRLKMPDIYNATEIVFKLDDGGNYWDIIKSAAIYSDGAGDTVFRKWSTPAGFPLATTYGGGDDSLEFGPLNDLKDKVFKLNRASNVDHEFKKIPNLVSTIVDRFMNSHYHLYRPEQGAAGFPTQQVSGFDHMFDDMFDLVLVEFFPTDTAQKLTYQLETVTHYEMVYSEESELEAGLNERVSHTFQGPIQSGTSYLIDKEMQDVAGMTTPPASTAAKLDPQFAAERESASGAGTKQQRRRFNKDYAHYPPMPPK